MPSRQEQQQHRAPSANLAKQGPRQRFSTIADEALDHVKATKSPEEYAQFIRRLENEQEQIERKKERARKFTEMQQRGVRRGPK